MYVVCRHSALVYGTIFKMKQGSKMKVIKTVTTVDGTLYADEIVKFQEAVNSAGDYRVKDSMGRIWFIKKENLE
jgi:hypothetical protein